MGRGMTPSLSMTSMETPSGRSGKGESSRWMPLSVLSSLLTSPSGGGACDDDIHLNL